MNDVPESYVPPEEYRRYRAQARGRTKFVDKRNDFKNEVNSLLDRNGITYDGSLSMDEGREFLDELTLGGPSQLLLEKWLEAIDEYEHRPWEFGAYIVSQNWDIIAFHAISEWTDGEHF